MSTSTVVASGRNPQPAGPFRPRPGLGVCLRRGLLGAGAGLPADLVDLDADSLRVRLGVPARPGETVQVTLRLAAFGRPVTRFGSVASCEPDAGGGTLAVLRLRHPLARSELNSLVER
jgi:hypothetical protein